MVLSEGRGVRHMSLQSFFQVLWYYNLVFLWFQMCSRLFPFLRVDNINAAVMDLKEKICILSEEAKIGAYRKPMIFLHPIDCGGVLVELEQAWWIIHKKLIALKKSYHSVLWHWVLPCFRHWEVRTKLWKGIYILLNYMCIYTYIYTQNTCWLLWIFSWLGENFEYWILMEYY